MFVSVLVLVSPNQKQPKCPENEQVNKYSQTTTDTHSAGVNLKWLYCMIPFANTF